MRRASPRRRASLRTMTLPMAPTGPAAMAVVVATMACGLACGLVCAAPSSDSRTTKMRPCSQAMMAPSSASLRCQPCSSRRLPSSRRSSGVAALTRGVAITRPSCSRNGLLRPSSLLHRVAQEPPDGLQPPGGGPAVATAPGGPDGREVRRRGLWETRRRMEADGVASLASLTGSGVGGIMRRGATGGMKGLGMALSRIAGISGTPRIARIARLPRISRYGAWALALILAGTAVRLAIVLLGYPADDSDEATMGLMALHIVTRGEHPIFFYGQNYMGALEAYLGAAFFRLFGVSVLSLRLSVLLLYALFLAAMYALTSLLYDRRLALIALLLLSLGTKEMIFREIEAAGGYSEVLLFGALALWLAAWLALRAHPDPSPAERRRRVAAYAALGLAAGVGIWSDWLILPFILTAFALVAIVCGRELRRLPGAALALGLVIGALPLIVFAFQLVFQAAPSSVAASVPAAGTPVAAATAPAGGAAVGLLRDPSVLVGEIGGTFLISLPNMTGATAVCPLKAADAWPLTGRAGFLVYACTVVRAGWGLLAVALWGWAVALAAAAVRRLWRRGRLEKWTPMRRRRVTLELSRLAVLGGAGLTLAA